MDKADITEIRRENLRRWVAEHGTPAKEKSLFSQLKGEGSFGERVARRLEEQYKMGAGYLDSDAAMPLGQYQRVQAVEPDDAQVVPIQKVRLRLSAGITGFQTEIDSHDGADSISISRAWIERKGYSPNKLIAIHVKGESMENALHEDDIVVINTADTKPADGFVFAVNYEGESVIKRLSRDIGEWWLTSDNPDQRKYHRKMCRGGECIIIGRVVKVESERI